MTVEAEPVIEGMTARGVFHVKRSLEGVVVKVRHQMTSHADLWPRLQRGTVSPPRKGGFLPGL